MKRYKIEHFQRDMSKPSYISEISKSDRRDGTTISFCIDGRKYYQIKFKNNLWNGLAKSWAFKFPKNGLFKNWKKGKMQGVIINFK